MPQLNRQQLAEHLGRLISQDRNQTHGDPHKQFEFAQQLKALIIQDCHDLGPTEFESLDLICTKISRIICGSNLQEHWLDIAGYALIAAEGAEEGLEEPRQPPQEVKDLLPIQAEINKRHSKPAKKPTPQRRTR